MSNNSHLPSLSLSDQNDSNNPFNSVFLAPSNHDPSHLFGDATHPASSMSVPAIQISEYDAFNPSAALSSSMSDKPDLSSIDTSQMNITGSPYVISPTTTSPTLPIFASSAPLHASFNNSPSQQQPILTFDPAYNPDGSFSIPQYPLAIQQPMYPQPNPNYQSLNQQGSPLMPPSPNFHFPLSSGTTPNMSPTLQLNSDFPYEQLLALNLSGACPANLSHPSSPQPGTSVSSTTSSFLLNNETFSFVNPSAFGPNMGQGTEDELGASFAPAPQQFGLGTGLQYPLPDLNTQWRPPSINGGVVGGGGGLGSAGTMGLLSPDSLGMETFNFLQPNPRSSSPALSDRSAFSCITTFGAPYGGPTSIDSINPYDPNRRSLSPNSLALQGGGSPHSPSESVLSDPSDGSVPIGLTPSAWSSAPFLSPGSTSPDPPTRRRAFKSASTGHLRADYVRKRSVSPNPSLHELGTSADDPNHAKVFGKGRTDRERIYPCTQPNCDKRFFRRQDLKRHLRTHAGAKPYGCTCGVRFSRSDALHRHIVKHQQEGSGGEHEAIGTTLEEAHAAWAGVIGQQGLHQHGGERRGSKAGVGVGQQGKGKYVPSAAAVVSAFSSLAAPQDGQHKQERPNVSQTTAILASMMAAAQGGRQLPTQRS